MTTEKVANYTAEQTTKMVADYQASVTVEAIATELRKTVRSLVAKLSREKEYVTKTGEKAVKKDEHADEIGVLLTMNENEIESLTKANKVALKLIVEALREFDAMVKAAQQVEEFDE